MSQPTLTGSGSINWVTSPAPTSEVPVGELDLIVGVLSSPDAPAPMCGTWCMKPIADVPQRLVYTRISSR